LAFTFYLYNQAVLDPLLYVYLTDMSVASHNVYSAVKDAYEEDWPGSTDVQAAVDVC